jgi:hypothetical protein
MLLADLRIDSDVESSTPAGILRVDIDAVFNENTHNINRVIFNGSVQRRSAAVARERKICTGGAKCCNHLEGAHANGGDERRAAFVVGGVDGSAGVDEAPDDKEVGHGGCGHEGS